MGLYLGVKLPASHFIHMCVYVCVCLNSPIQRQIFLQLPYFYSYLLLFLLTTLQHRTRVVLKVTNEPQNKWIRLCLSTQAMLRWFSHQTNVSLPWSSRHTQVYMALHCLVARSCLTLQPHGLQHSWLPWPSLSPGVCSDSCPLSWWCHTYLAAPTKNILYLFQGL